MLIRRTRADDVSGLKAMLQQVWHQTYAPFLGRARVDQLTTMWHTPEKQAAETTAENCVSLVAENIDDIVGHALVADEGEGHLHLRRLYLQATYHGHGVGAQLLNAALSAFPQGRSVRLEVYENNARAVAFYRAQGFAVCEKLRDEFADDELYEFRMIKAL
ncbi:hypothetical protein MXMO3_01951 [Maritalea myrionectae]|uniref:N-acetyltransferase domain-containing protein n=1 Tax=Maritalea myrionectae TaxID=454601 RepID=A0A2R4MEV4_9HYPH|nr:GNAT family N-acetyltransferase [Maritalea myrionectae]AVX04475.1 hypothetical protein MXMO3_01951 [Maritalea myrionectae]